LLITIPACTQPSRLTELLGFLFPAAAVDNAATAVLACQVAGWVLFPVAICSGLRNCRIEPIGAARDATFALMFALADPLLSFAIYFCVWHSIRGLLDLHQQVGGKPHVFICRLLPVSALTLCCAALAWRYLTLASDMPTATMRTVFIGLSAIATPHLLLHSLVDCRQVVENRLFIKTPGLAS
jgi:Brp/Blh family beta-carotene 15,15'-monooxygenase